MFGQVQRGDLRVVRETKIFVRTCSIQLFDLLLVVDSCQRIDDEIH